MSSYATLFGALLVGVVCWFTLRGVGLRGIPAWRWAAFVGYLALVGVIGSGIAELTLTYPLAAAVVGLLLVSVVYVLTRYSVGPFDLARLSVPRRKSVAPSRAGGTP